MPTMPVLSPSTLLRRALSKRSGKARPTIWLRHSLKIGLRRKQIAKPYFAICFSRISSRVLQSIHKVAVGLASKRFRPISMPHLSQ